VAIADELAVVRQPLDGIALPDGVVAVDVVDRPGVEHEVAAVDPPLAHLRLLVELDDLVPLEVDAAEARRGAHGGHGGELAVRAVKAEERVEVDVGDAVPVGEEERLRRIEPAAQALQAPAGLRVEPGLDEVHLPPRLVAFVDDGLPAGEVDGEIVVERIEIEEVLLHDLGLVAERDDELRDGVGAEDVHDVPEDRLAADLDHGFGPQDRLLGETGAEPTRKDDRFHVAVLSIAEPPRAALPTACATCCRVARAPGRSSLSGLPPRGHPRRSVKRVTERRAGACTGRVVNTSFPGRTAAGPHEPPSAHAALEPAVEDPLP
jgi:hypothetical protein